MTDLQSIHKFNPREVRQGLGLNQQQFWSRVGVTQSGGSRYEGGRRMPKPVEELVRIIHVEKIAIEHLKRDDLDVLDYLRYERPDLLAELRKMVKNRRKPAA